MKKKGALLLALLASVAYFIIFVMLKSLQTRNLDWENAFLGALIFFLLFFFVYRSPNRAKQLLKRAKEE